MLIGVWFHQLNSFSLSFFFKTMHFKQFPNKNHTFNRKNVNIIYFLMSTELSVKSISLLNPIFDP